MKEKPLSVPPERIELRLVKPVKEKPEKSLVVNPQQLDEICLLTFDQAKERADLLTLSDIVITEEQERKEEPNFKRFWEIINALQDRNFSTELPIQEQSFTYKRNLAECQKLRLSVIRMEKLCRGNAKDWNKEKEEQFQKFLFDACRLFAIEKKKARWLEKEQYPVMFGRAVNTARAEVFQFLIKQKNMAELEQIKDLEKANVELLDELTYLQMYPGHEKSVGLHVHGQISLRVPPYFTMNDEWRMYFSAVHEFVHEASFQCFGRTGLSQEYADPSFNELNEAVTQFVTFIIAQEHLAKNKTPLAGERAYKATLSSIGYADYVAFLRKILDKVPLSLFIDAMLNESGLKRLQAAFEQVFDDPDALVNFGAQMRDLYKPKKKGGQKTEQVKKNEMGELIDFLKFRGEK